MKQFMHKFDEIGYLYDGKLTGCLGPSAESTFCVCDTIVQSSRKWFLQTIAVPHIPGKSDWGYWIKESFNETQFTSINVRFEYTEYEYSVRILFGCPTYDGARVFSRYTVFLVTNQHFMCVAKLKNTLSPFGLRPIQRKCIVDHFRTRWGTVWLSEQCLPFSQLQVSSSLDWTGFRRR